MSIIRCYPLGSGKAAKNGRIQSLIYLIKQNLKERKRCLKTIVKSLCGITSEFFVLLSVENLEVTLSQPNLTLESKLNFLALANRAVALQEEAIKIREFMVKEGETLRRDITVGIPRESVLKLISGRGLRILRKKWESRNSLMSYTPLVKQLEKKWGDLQLQLRTEGEKMCGRPWPLFSDAQTQTKLKERDRI